MRFKAVHEWIQYDPCTHTGRKNIYINKSNAPKASAMCTQYHSAIRDPDHFHRACFKISFIAF